MNPMNVEVHSDFSREVRCISVSGLKPDFSFKHGIEVGTLETFFSFENSSLGSSLLSDTSFHLADKSWFFTSNVQIGDAEINVTENGSVEGRGGARFLVIRALKTSYLMDTVLRFVIPKDQVKEAIIGVRSIKHERRNRYHQFPVDCVRLVLHSGAILSFAPIAMQLPRGFSPVVYLRDEPDVWILHYRALALHPTQFVLKGCIRWYNKAVPLAFQRALFSFLPSLRRKLLYIRERVSQRIPFQVNGAAELAQGEMIQMSVAWEIQHAA